MIKELLIELAHEANMDKHISLEQDSPALDDLMYFARLAAEVELEDAALRVAQILNKRHFDHSQVIKIILENPDEIDEDT
jgi:hypothetical protein